MARPADLAATWKAYGCRACAHFRPSSATCIAFPGGIPIQVISTDLDHFRPIDGQSGDATFDPIPGIPAG